MDAMFAVGYTLGPVVGGIPLSGWRLYCFIPCLWMWSSYLSNSHEAGDQLGLCDWDQAQEEARVE